jgi:hypothetical protein
MVNNGEALLPSLASITMAAASSDQKVFKLVKPDIPPILRRRRRRLLHRDATRGREQNGYTGSAGQ